MGLQKFGSVRSLERPAGTTRLTPFRDDNSLVALRYEQTKQAEPPIPLPPPRNPRRITRTPSTLTSSTARTSCTACTASTTRSARSTSTASTTSRPSPRSSPIVIPPPASAPPQEQHPLFRKPSVTPRPQGSERKRDSGAPTSSTVTLREEHAEDPVNTKSISLSDDIADTPSLYSADKISLDVGRVALSTSSPPPLSVSIPPPDEVVVAVRKSSSSSAASSPTQWPTQPLSPASPTSPALPKSPTSPSTPPSPTRRTSLVRKLSKTFGINIGGDGNKLRKKMLGTDKADKADRADRADRAAPPQAAPPQAAPPEPRGSPKPPKSPKSPKPPKSPKSPRLSPLLSPWSSPKLPPHETGLRLVPRTVDRANAVDNANVKHDRDSPFAPITTQIPEVNNLWDDLGAISFSKRGSIMFGGKTDLLGSLLMSDNDYNDHDGSSPLPHPATKTASSSSPSSSPTPRETAAMAENPRARARAAPQPDAPSVPSIRVSSMDVERESQKVRSLYESADGLNWEDGGCVAFAERLEPTAEVPSEEEENAAYGFP